MHDAGALPDLHILAACLRLDVIAQIDVRQEQNRLGGGDRLHNGHCVVDVQTISLSAFTWPRY